MMAYIKKLPFYRRYTTRQFRDWWRNRKIDWDKQYLQTWNHPHRQLITAVLKKMGWLSLMEIGCGGGANLVNIAKNIPGRMLGGIDVNPEAIEVCKKVLQGGAFFVNSGDNIIMSDNSTDIVLSDMYLIYVGPTQIGKHIREIRRIARNSVVFYEFHSDSWWRRWWLRLFSGHNAYDYKKLLKKQGFYDVHVYKVPNQVCDDATQKEFGHIIIASLPRRK